MSKPSLRQLYRSEAAQAALPDAEAVLRVAEGSAVPQEEVTLVALARAPLSGDLVRFARALEPASAALGRELAAALRSDGAGHAPRLRRATHGMRRGRLAAAAAAALVVAIGVWSLAHRHAPSAPQAQVSPPDRIFAGFNERAVAGSQARPDEIFRGRFLPDEIFNSRGNDG